MDKYFHTPKFSMSPFYSFLPVLKTSSKLSRHEQYYLGGAGLIAFPSLSGRLYELNKSIWEDVRRSVHSGAIKRQFQ